MKKGLTGILTAAVILSISTTTVWAAGPGTGCRFVDADGNGICDYAGNGCYYADADGDGICDNHGENICLHCDADGDGICDSCGGEYVRRESRSRGHHGGYASGSGCEGAYGHHASHHNR